MYNIIHYPLQSKLHVMCYSDSGENERKEWFDSISEACSRQKELISDNCSSSTVAPLWNPDSNSRGCQLCKANFGLINRRHHCRNCGILVCDKCSSKRFFLAHVNDKSNVRVCDTCYEDLSNSSSGNRDSPSSMLESSSKSRRDFGDALDDTEGLSPATVSGKSPRILSHKVSSSTKTPVNSGTPVKDEDSKSGRSFTPPPPTRSNSIIGNINSVVRRATLKFTGLRLDGTLIYNMTYISKFSHYILCFSLCLFWSCLCRRGCIFTCTTICRV